MNFDQAIERVSLSEGGFSENPADPGNWTGGKVGAGELRGTKFGIAANTFPTLDIRNLTLTEAHEIYREKYWNVIGGDQLPDAVAYAALDFAVNSGCETAVRYLQRAAGVADDGRIGEVSLAAFNAIPSAVLAMMYLGLRLEFMTKLKAWETFNKGWAKRISDVAFYSAKDLTT